jgi:membrane dipeptidase
LRARRPIVIDTLGGLGDPNVAPVEPPPQPDITGLNQRALRDGHRSGLTAFNQTIGYISGSQEPFEYTVRDVAGWIALIRERDREFVHVLRAADIRRAHDTKRFGVILGFQNSAMMGTDVRRVRLFAELGVRVIQLTYNVRNQLGDGSMVEANAGLSEFGREVVAELNACRVIVDLSHSGEQTCLDAIHASRRPIAITHTGCRAVADLPRNKTDRELRLVAESGGVVGIYFMPFLAIGRQPTAQDLLAHIEHAINVCGEDHVAIGTDGQVSAVDDLDAYLSTLKAEVDRRRAAGISATGERADIVPFLPDLDGAGKFWRLAELLAGRGHSSSRIDKILGLNFLRYADSIWGAGTSAS